MENRCIRHQEQGEEVPQFERAAVCFLHVYDRKQSVARVRDHDNIEEKQMVDALGMFFLVSDGGLYLDTFHTSLLGEEDRTCLFLMDQEEFPQWIHRLEEDRKISKNETTWEGENPTGQDIRETPINREKTGAVLHRIVPRDGVNRVRKGEIRKTGRETNGDTGQA